MTVNRLVTSYFFDELFWTKEGAQKFRHATVNNTGATTDGALVAAVTGYYIRILNLVMSGPANVSIQINSKPAGAGGRILGPHPILASVPLVLPFDLVGYAQTSLSEGIAVTSTGDCSVDIGYVLIQGS